MKNENKLREAKEKLDFLSGVIGKILDGELNQGQAAREIGISAQAFGRQLQDAFTPFIRTRILKEKDLSDIAKTMRTPVETLVGHVFGIMAEEEILMIDFETQEKILALAKETLKEREYSVLSARYGLDDNYPGHTGLSLDESGKCFGIQRERVRQIQSQAIRRLRNPKIWRQLVPGYETYVKALMDLDDMKRMELRMHEEYNSVLTCMRWLQYQKNICNIFNTMFDRKRMTFAEDVLVSDMPVKEKEIVEELSSHGIRTIRDLMSMDEDTAVSVGKALGISLGSIENFCCKACVFPDYFYRYHEIMIEDMDLSVRSYNALRKSRLLTVSDVAKKGMELKKIRNLGRKSYEEIRHVMKEKYGVDIEAVNTDIF